MNHAMALIVGFLAATGGVPKPREESSDFGISWWAVATLAIIVVTALGATAAAYLRKKRRDL